MEIVVFVHLGKNVAPTLNLFAQQAQESYSNASVILLTDIVSNHNHFPGKVIEVETTGLFSDLKSDDNKLHKRMGGYWLHTLNRIFVLKNLASHFPKDTKVIHLESDVLCLINNRMAQEIWSQFKGVGVPRFSNDSGIASILIASDIEQLTETLQSLEILAKNSDDELDDMHLLGKGLNQKILKDLNAERICYRPSESENDVEIYFDGCAAGQYLFGSDKIHTSGYIKSGYSQANSLFQFSDVNWQSPKWQRKSELTLDYLHLNKIFRIANLHVHSKLGIISSEINSKFWVDVIAKANSGQITVYEVPTFIYRFKEVCTAFLLRVKSSING